MAIPLPNPPGAGGGLLEALDAANEYQKNRTAAIYAPALARAEAMSRGAYASTAMPEAIAKFLSSPAAANMTRPEFEQLNKLFQSYVNNVPNISHMFDQIDRPGLGGRLVNMFLNKISGGQPQGNALNQPPQEYTPSASTNNVNVPPGAPQGEYRKVGGASEYVPSGGNEQPVATGAVGIGPVTSAGQQAAAMNGTERMGGNNPNTATKVQETVATTAAQGQTEDEVKMMSATKQNAQNLSALAPQLEKITDSFDANYNNSYYKGARKGSVHSSGVAAGPTFIGNDLTPEQLTDTAAEQAANTIANWLNSGGGHVNDSLREQAKSIKGFSRSLDKGAKEVIVDQTRAFTDRGSEYGDFVPFVTRNNPNITSAELNQLFNKYQRYFPNYDYKNNKPNHENDDLWRIFASPEALTIYRTTGNFKPTDVHKMPNGRIFFKINGRLFSE